ncbi:MAG: metalloregulator ArsR/SmtB family transcription factor [Gammaproteobacteria bacterium]|nr:metalloregulator ArsR/SmtB family transcription factor [Gammaproteobacteria bacterium]
MNNREIKDALFGQVARMTKAVASPKRLELIELLSQAPKSVERLAREADISPKLASAHLKELRGARLVESQRQGKRIIYRVSSPEVPQFWVLLRTLAEDRLFELKDALRQLSLSRGEWCEEDRMSLLRKAREGEIVMLDVRPADEYEQAHLPFARSMPLAELHGRIAELPLDKTILVYCRGPYCLMSKDAVLLLEEQGYQAVLLSEGVAEWAVAASAESGCDPVLTGGEAPGRK